MQQCYFSVQTGLNINYADDVTQIIGYQGPSKNMMNRRTAHEIKKLNTFEQHWKIKTNITKFTPIHLGARNTIPLDIDDNIINFQHTGTSLGQRINTHGYTTNTTVRRAKANTALTKLYRFKHMPQNIKLHLVKAFVLPTLDYPPIPTHTLSKTQTRKLQKIQNKALRFATNQRYPYTMNTRQIHNTTNTAPINIRLHNQAVKTWKKIETQNNTIYNKLKEELNNIRHFNKRFPSSLQNINTPPEPIYN